MKTPLIKSDLKENHFVKIQLYSTINFRSRKILKDYALSTRRDEV